MTYITCKDRVPSCCKRISHNLFIGLPSAASALSADAHRGSQARPATFKFVTVIIGWKWRNDSDLLASLRARSCSSLQKGEENKMKREGKRLGGTGDG